MAKDDQRGSVAAEYALLLAGIAIAVSAAMAALGIRISAFFELN